MNLKKKDFTGILFSPEKGKIVREPVGEGRGFWAGAPGIFFDESQDKYFLVYRLRRPRGQHPDRGFEVRIAESSDGIEFEDIGSIKKEELNTTSIERCAIYKKDGVYLFYISYVDPTSLKWRIDVIETEDLRKIDISQRKKVFIPEELNIEGIKDPYIFTSNNKLYMIVSYAISVGDLSDTDKHKMHATADAYNTGLIKSCTGLAVSNDGINFEWKGDILSPEENKWDQYCRRVSSLIYLPGIYIALYDGSYSVKENYEERCGIAVGLDIEHLMVLSCNGPIVKSQYGMGSVRYVDVLQKGNKLYFYYEYTREDLSHDLRVYVREL